MRLRFPRESISKCRVEIIENACMGVWLSATFQRMDAATLSRDQVESCAAPLHSGLSAVSARVEPAESSRSRAQRKPVLEEQRTGGGAKVFLAVNQCDWCWLY